MRCCREGGLAKVFDFGQSCAESGGETEIQADTQTLVDDTGKKLSTYRKSSQNESFFSKQNES